MRTLLLLAALGLSACAPEPPPLLDWTDAERELIARLSPLPSLPEDPTNSHADSAGAAELGRLLFHDVRLSPDHAFSCATCHEADKGLADGLPLPAGRGPIARHSPSLWNTAHQRWWFWDGRADTLWGQAAGPIANPLEMNSGPAIVAGVVLGDESLLALYEAEFGAAETAEIIYPNLLKSLAAFERTLVSGHSPFDRFARGLASNDADDLGALNLEQQRGLRLFIGQGRCTLCHGGPLFSDREFHDTRVPPLDGGPAGDAARFEGIAALLADPAFTSFGPHSDAPDGTQARLSQALVREGRTWGEFKTPSLREVALSPPYMHQGQFATLAEVVRYYSTLEGALPLGHHQETLLVPAELDDGQQADLVAFLQSLTSRSTVD
jgi:cytochrome c peroxidase